MESIGASLGRWIIRCRWWVLIVLLGLLIPAAYGIRFLRTTSDNRVFLGEHNSHLKALEAFEDTYTRDENVFIAIEPKDGSIFTCETLAAVQELTEAAWHIPYVRRVDSITNFQHTRADGDDLVVENLIRNPMDLTGAEIEHIRTIALNEPLLLNRLISSSGLVTAINVTTAKPGRTVEENAEVAEYVRSLAKDFREEHTDLNIYLTSVIMLDHAFMEATEADMSTLIPTMFLIMVLLIAILLRSIPGTLSTVIVIVASAGAAMGLAGWYGIDLTAATGIAPVIILTLAVADSIHILSTMLQGMRFGKAREEAIVESMRINLHPVFLTSTTTAIGFLSMNFSDVPPFRELGTIVAVGVMAALLYSILLLPALMSILPVRTKGVATRGNQVGDYCGRFVVRRRNMLLWGMMGLTVALAVGLTRLEFGDNLIQYFDKSFAIRTDSDFVQQNLTGLDLIEYSLDSGEEGGISSPEYLAKVEEFADWLQQQPEVMHVNSITDIMKRLNRNMHGDDSAYYRIPDSRELAAQYLLLYEMSLPFGLDLNNQINLDKSASRLTVLMKEPSTARQIEVEKRANQWLKENAPATFSGGTGLTVVWAHITEQNIQSMVVAVGVAIVLISLILIFAFRSLKFGTISLIPNLLPTIMAFGLWGLIVGRVNLGVSVVAAMSLGIVVDDTVHFLSKYLHARRALALNPIQAVNYSFTTVGMAILTTSVVLFMGFMVLTFSRYGMTSAMGLLTAIAIAFALFTDFLLLPPLLMKAEEKEL